MAALVTRPGAVLIARGTARDLGLAAGARLAVRAAGIRRELTVVGLLDPADPASARALDGLLVTDITVDGMLEGPNVDLYAELAEVARVPIIASGGVSELDDLIALARVPGVEGAIVGKALYVGAIDLGDAIKAVA